jgi:hypothetical protein
MRWQRAVQTVPSLRVAPRPLAETVNQPTVLMCRSARAGAENSDPHVQLRAVRAGWKQKLLSRCWQRTVQTVQSPRVAPRSRLRW